MTNNNITMIRGDTQTFDVDIEGVSSAISAAYFTCKDKYGGATQFQKSLGSGITSSQVGKCTVTIAPADTAGLSAGIYVYDLEIQLSATQVYTIMRGNLVLEEAVTTGNDPYSDVSELVYGSILESSWGS